MLSLPPVGHKAREMFDVSHLVALTTAPILEMPTKRETIRSAEQAMRENKAIRRIHSICMDATDEWQLLSIGPRGGVRIEWRFGKKYGRAA